MKPKWIASGGIFFLLVLAGGFLVLMRAPRSVVADAPHPDAIQERVMSLTQTWWRHLQGPGWLYVKQTLISPSSKGDDPDTGWPLFRQSTEEAWSISDAEGHVQTLLLRSTDLEHPQHIYRTAWENGHMLRQPPFQDSPPQWNHWDYRFVLDAGCARELQQTQNTPRTEASVEISASPGSAPNLWRLVLTSHFDPIALPELGAKGPFVASQIICLWDTQTPRLLKVTHNYLTEKGQPVLAEEVEYLTVQRVASPPADMMALLKQLRVGEHK